MDSKTGMPLESNIAQNASNHSNPAVVVNVGGEITAPNVGGKTSDVGYLPSAPVCGGPPPVPQTQGYSAYAPASGYPPPQGYPPPAAPYGVSPSGYMPPPPYGDPPPYDSLSQTAAQQPAVNLGYAPPASGQPACQAVVLVPERGFWSQTLVPRRCCFKDFLKVLLYVFIILVIIVRLTRAYQWIYDSDDDDDDDDDHYNFHNHDD